MERAAVTRMRWRLRGAWQWPTFGALLVVDAVLVAALPLADGRPDAFAALVLSLFFNLVAVAAIGPALGWAWRRRHPQLPSVVARDRGGTTALVLTAVTLAAIGVANGPARRDAQDRRVAGALALADYVTHGDDPAHRAFRAHLDAIDTVDLGGGLLRACVPGDDPARALCVFVRTDRTPPTVAEDPIRAPNQTAP